MTKKKIITVFGSSAIRPGDPEFDTAENLGRALAEAGYTTCNGGYMGSMEAAAKGAQETGGEVIGVTTEDFSRVRKPNPYLTEERRQPTLLDRIQTLIELADAYVVLPGGIGTMAELFVVWNLLAMRVLPERPVLLLGDRYPDLLKAFSRDTEIGPEHLRFLKMTTTIEDVLAELARHFD